MKRISGRSLLVVVVVISGLGMAVTPDARGSEGTQQPGLVRVHFDAPFFTRPREWAVEPQINLDTDGPSEYSRIWLGRVRIPTSHEVTFSVEADLARDPARNRYSGLVLTIGGKKIIDGWSTSARVGLLKAEEGEELPLELKFYQIGEAGFVRLYWAWKGHPSPEKRREAGPGRDPQCGPGRLPGPLPGPVRCR